MATTEQVEKTLNAGSLPDEGDRNIIRMPSGERYYLLAFPFADKDCFSCKMPYENRPENAKERRALDEIMDKVNVHVRAIHEHYLDVIDDLTERVRISEGR